jgi:fructuronate reductase
MRYCLGMNENREPYDLRDPRETEIELLLGGARNDSCSVVDRLMSMPGLFPDELSSSPEWHRAVSTRLETMLSKSMRAAIDAEVRRAA